MGFKYEKITSKRNNKIYQYFIRRYKKDTYNYNHFKRIINDQEVLLTNEDSEIKRIYDAYNFLMSNVKTGIASETIKIMYYMFFLEEIEKFKADDKIYAVSGRNDFPMHIMYKGYYYDEETKLYYCMSRYYSPEFRRFISPDKCDYLETEEPNGLNLYCYCGNDPVNNYDPSGHSAILIGMLIGFGVGALIGGGFEIAKQAYNGGDWNWDMSSWDWGQIGLSALGGGVAGAISSISFGSGVIGYLTTFATGGIGSVLGGIISGSVTDLQSVLIAFGVGAVANVVARGITALINKGVSAGAQKALSNPIFDDMTLGDLASSALKNNGYSPAYNKLLNQAANLVLKANGQWARSSMYSFANAGISSLLSGWY